MMAKVDEVVLRGNRAVLPAIMEGMRYIKLSEGAEFTITKVAYSVYKARNADGSEKITKSGRPICTTCAYIGFDDGTYSTVKNDYAVSQLISVTGRFAEDTPGVYEYENIHQKVKIMTKDIKYGSEVHPSWVFLPIEG